MPDISASIHHSEISRPVTVAMRANHTRGDCTDDRPKVNAPPRRTRECYLAFIATGKAALTVEDRAPAATGYPSSKHPFPFAASVHWRRESRFHIFTASSVATKYQSRLSQRAANPGILPESG